MHQSVTTTDAIFHALGDPSQAYTGIRTHVYSLRGRRLTNWAIRLSTPNLFKVKVIGRKTIG